MMIWRSRSCTTQQQDNTSVNWISTALIAGSSLVFLPLLAAHAEGPAETYASASHASEATPNAALEEIVITARRKGELLQDVPLTVTPVTAEELQKLNLQNLKDIAEVVPGLQIVPNSVRALDSNTFRGVSFFPQSGTQNTLGFYINDTFVANNFVTTSLFDVGQIELLGGPQGTLRGEPSPSGSLTITTRRPDLEHFGGYVTATATHLGNTNENAAVNLPIIQDKLAVRFAGLFDADDLDGVKSVNSSASPYNHTYDGRFSVRFEPIDAIEANVMYQHGYWHQNQFSQVEGPGAPGGVNPNAPANYNGPPISATERLGVQTFPTTTRSRQDIVTAQLDWHVLDQLLTYDGSYWKYTIENGALGTLTQQGISANQVPGMTAANPVPFEPFQFDTPSVTQHTQTQELRLSSETPIFGFLDYTLGGFFRYTKNQVDTVQLATFFPGAFGTPLAAPDPFIYNPKYTLPLLVQSPAAEKEYSEFANFTFHLPSNTELAVGGRHVKYQKAGYTEATLLPNGAFAALPPAALGFPPGVPCGAFGFGSTYPNTCDIPASVLLGGHNTALPLTPQNLTDSTWIYNLSLSHKLNENLLTYVNVGSSWRPPGVSVGINNAANDPTLNSLLHLKPETSTDFEGGLKWTFLDHRARLNVAYFHQKFKNFIYSGLPTLYLSDNGSGAPPSVTPFNFNTNPDAVLNGVELDTGVRITRNWNVDLHATYTNGHLTGSQIPCSPPSGGQTAAAFPPGTHVFLCPSNASTSVAPNFTSSALSEYHTPIPGAGNIDGFIRGIYTYYGRNPHASEFYVAPSYGIVNLFLGLRSPGGAWEGAFFAKNAFNAKPVLVSGVGNPAIDAQSLSATFGSSGYYSTQVAPRQEFGITFTYAIGSR
jgi:iron complex outermembrane receptor protein